MDNNDNKILIVTGGKIEDAFLLEYTKKERYAKIIAVDRGLIAIDRLQLSVDFIVGDFDSVSKDILDKYKDKSTPIETFPTEKDKTDTQIAIELALMHNPSAIDVIGATGSRLDHVLGNIHLLLLPMQLGIQACLLDSNNKIYLRNTSFSIRMEKQFGDFVSLLPFSEAVSGLTLEGFKYPLHHITLTAGTSLGISNEIKDDEAVIEFSEGVLLVIESRD